MASSRGPRIEAAGLRQLQKDLKKTNKALLVDLGTTLQRAAAPIVTEAKTLAPRGTRPIPKDRVPRKRLADTITARRRGLMVAIAARGPHAEIVHDGGRHPLYGDREHWIAVRPRPFITHSIDDHADQTMNAMADAVETTLRRNGFN